MSRIIIIVLGGSAGGALFADATFGEHMALIGGIIGALLSTIISAVTLIKLKHAG